MTSATPPSSRPPAPRPRLRRLLPLLVAVWVALEIWLLALLGDAMGGWAVFLLLVAGVVVGGSVSKRAGRRAWRNLTRRVQTATGTPDGESGAHAEQERGDGTVAGNAFAMLGGLLIMVPGVLSDVAGLLCLFPPTRKLAGRRAERLLTGVAGRRYSPGSLGDAFQQARMHRPDGTVVQGEVVREDEQPPSDRRNPPLNP